MKRPGGGNGWKWIFARKKRRCCPLVTDLGKTQAPWGCYASGCKIAESVALFDSSTRFGKEVSWLMERSTFVPELMDNFCTVVFPP